ncbi:TetR/AcrR family transcriptional regulator [Gammaproteobacteria bacterium]|nr:TetR/AcrR family transcriptional regulator [Gammaproteobacteria bacterium]MDC0005657.1 TetR/AcrR family transcriptional regulator [Gammaproteobacteria bacterium]
MIKPVQAHGNIKRQANKKLRRERIFNIAKSIIASKGLEDFTIADLAQEAGVTTPTIHNLFGKKDDIAQELIEELVLSLKSIMSKPIFDDPIESANFYVDSIIEMYQGNEDFYRSAYMAGEKAGIFNDRESEDSFFKQSEKVAELCCLGALKNGFLLGNIDINVITRQLYQCHRTARQDWVYGDIDLKGYRSQVLEGMLMVYATDASPECHKRISKELKAISIK